MTIGHVYSLPNVLDLVLALLSSAWLGDPQQKHRGREYSSFLNFPVSLSGIVYDPLNRIE